MLSKKRYQNLEIVHVPTNWPTYETTHSNNVHGFLSRWSNRPCAHSLGRHPGHQVPSHHENMDANRKRPHNSVVSLKSDHQVVHVYLQPPV